MPWYNSTAKPMWIPGYPGSGSEMLRTIVKAITGLGGHGIYGRDRCFNHSATCKTHWPRFPDKFTPSEYTDATAKRTAILIRNPKDAMPSYFSYLWELKNRIIFHTTQAPEEDWNAWRDETFSHELSKYWKGLIQSWKESDYEIAFYLQYERLVDIETGPELVSKLAAELRSNGIQVAADEDIPCLWYKVVKKGHRKKRKSHKYVPSFRRWQQARMLRTLEKLQREFEDDTELVGILSMYHDDIGKNTRIQDDDTHTNSR